MILLLAASICLAADEPSTTEPDTGSANAPMVEAVDLDVEPTPTVYLVDTNVIIPQLDFTGVSLFDALTALGRAYSLSLYIDSSVVGNIGIRLDSVSLNDALLFIIKEYDLAWDKTGEIIKIYKPVPPPVPPEPLDISYENGLLSLDVRSADVSRVVDTLVDLSGRNIVLENNARGKITAKLADLEFEKALKIALPANGFSVRTIDEIIYVGIEAGAAGGGQRQNLLVDCDGGLITLNASEVSVSSVLSILASECGVNLFLNAQVEGQITASFVDKSVEEALTCVLLNSKYTFKESDGVYFVGTKESEDLHSTKLVKLKHLIATTLTEMIPVTLSQQLTIHVAIEHNGLLLTGPRTSIARLESFIDEVDVPVAQVLFEVLVVDYSTTDRAEFGLTMNNYGGSEGLPGQTYYPNVDLSDTGDKLNDKIRSMERHLGVSNLGTLGDDFFVRLQAMEQEGQANVRSRPKIATLNGHEASIEIGTTQYYLLENATTYPTQGNPTTATAQRFETITADMSLKVTPYVNEGDGMIVEVHPIFNTPASAFDPDIPPTINKRIIESTVKLRNGETIVLGGLVQETESKIIDKVPVLGSIPIIGRIFQNHSSEKTESELMIYITPYVYYGSEGAVSADSLLIRR